MKYARFAVGFGFLALLGMMIQADEKLKDIKTCMKTLASGRDSLKNSVKSSLSKKDWSALEKQSEQWVSIAETLTKSKPPKGTDDEWKEKTEAFLKSAKKLQDASGKKDSAIAKEAYAELTNPKTCGGCHLAHR